MGTIWIKVNPPSAWPGAWGAAVSTGLQGQARPSLDLRDRTILLLPSSSLLCGPLFLCPACCEDSLIPNLVEITRTLLFDPAISPPGIYPTEILALVPNDR